MKLNTLNTNLNQFRYLSFKKVRTWYAKLVPPRSIKEPYRHVIQIGDPRLRTVSEGVPLNLITTPEIQLVINQLKVVFKKYKCVGLSATQIGVPIRIFLMEFNEKHATAYSEQERNVMDIKPCPLKVVINPEIKILDYTKLVFPEACESVKGFYADVPRYRSLNLKGLDENGKSFSHDFSGWLARIIQHEMDHLNGITYIDLMDRKTFTCGCWNVINEHGGKVELPYSPD
ncbi:hypothetical protein NQ315_012085 [Exocentrus adspersus]|uniref:Peptide deformylase n=1 Tax=Exocentrus adspersus TaxID=1586481 RepID=A0AAV8VZ56_9CUCU|nr:hypothetical protein NQ315_012085 [Exocentrus adspersus]